MKIVILREWHPAYINYIKACEELNVDYQVINIMDDDWLEQIKNSKCDGILLYPSYFKQYLKNMYDERTYFIKEYLKIPIYPSFNEVFIYENKNNMEYWLSIHNIKHAQTKIFYRKDQALEYIDNAKYPLVFKTKLGTQGMGTKFIYRPSQAKRIINKVFSKMHFYARGFTKWYRHKKYRFLFAPMIDDKQFGVVMFQEKIPNIKCEWRMIRIGDSYFGHQKLEAKNGKHSGSSLVGWVKPPIELLELTKYICDIGNFLSMNVDIFETVDGQFYVNELQTIFGSINNSQMYIDGVPGRYRYINKEWVFEEGYFNQNASMNLRVKHFIEILEEMKNEE